MSRTRRVLAVLVASGLISTGLLGGTALAADQSLSISPGYGPNNSSSAQTVTLTTTGSGFLPGASVVLTYHGVPSRTITNSSPVQISPTDQKKMTTAIPLTAQAPGVYDVKVTNPPVDGSVYSCASCFTVTGGVPTVNGFGRTANNGTNPASFTLTGTNVAVGTTLSFAQAGVVDPAVVWTTTSTTGSSVVGTLAIGAAAKGGTYDVVVTNTDQKSATCAACLQVPKVTGVRRTDQSVDTTSTGLGYGVAHAHLVVSGVGLTPATNFSFFSESGKAVATKVNSQTFDATSKSATLDVSVSDPTSSPVNPVAVDHYGVVAVDKGDGYGAALDVLTLSPRPALDSSAPFDKDNPGQGSTGFRITLKGTGFQPGMTAALSPATGITVNSLTVTSPTAAVLDLTLAGDAPLTARDLHLTNPDLGVDAGSTQLTPSAAPVIASSSPASIGIGASSVALTLTGSGFQTQSLGENGSASTSNSYNTPQLFVFGHSDWKMTGSAVASNSGKTLTGTLTVPAGTPAGTYRIGYLDKNGSIVECFTASHGPCLTVEDLAVSSVSPDLVQNDTTTQTLTITGANFAAGAVPVLQRAGQPDVVGTNVHVLSASQLTADFDVDGIAPGDHAWDVRVSLPDGSTGHDGGALTVAGQVPHLTSISPSALGAGNPAQVLTVNGTDLARGATLTFSGLGSTGPTQVASQWISRNQMRFTLSTVGASSGQRGIVLTNTDGQATPSSDCAVLSCLTINAAPTVSSASPASRAAGSQTVSVTVNGSFTGTPSVSFSGTGISVGSPTSVSSSSVNVPVTVAPDADPGARSITVTNPDGGMATCSGCFTVKAPPTVTGVSPAAQRIGTGPTTVTISGTGFNTGGVAVSFGPGTTTGTPSVTATAITVPVTVSATATPGTRDVTVLNTPADDGGSATDAAAFTVGDLPSAPRNLGATRSNGVVNLKWDPPTSDGGLDLTGYDVAVTKTADGSAPSPTPSVTVEGTTAQVAGLVNGTSYSFTVAAKNAVGTGAATAPVTATPASVPDAPADVVATAGDGSADLSWTAPNDGGSPLTSYQVLFADGSPAATVSPTSTSTTIGNLTNGTAYSFYVVAVNAVGASPASATTDPVTPLPAVPGAPTGLVADVTAAAGEADLSWTAPAGETLTPLTSYTVSVTPSAGTITYPSPATATTATVTGLTNGVAYTFTVRGVTSAGAGAASQPATATPYTVPGAVTALTSKPADKAITATWAAPASNGGRAVTSYTATLTPGGAVQTVTGTSATFAGLTNGTAYTVAVHATNLRGDGPSVDAAPATPRATASITLGSLPSRISATTAITLTGTLTRPETGVPAGKVVLRVRNDSGVWSTVASVAPDATGKYSYRFAPLHNGTYVATYAGDARNTAAVSVARRTLVAVRISAAAPTGSHTVNQVISGTVQPGKAGYTVSLYSVSSTGKLTRLATARVSSKSTYSFSLRLSQGNHLLQVGMASTPGNDHGEVRFIAKRT